MNRVYLDNNSTTPLHSEVKAAMVEALDMYGNPSSLYSAGIEARKKVEHARVCAARLINAKPAEITFTSCGSESNNTILNPVALHQLFAKSGRNEVIVSAIEHPSVINSAKNLEQNGIKVHYAPVDAYGSLVWEKFTALLSEKTAIVSVMLANNEIGTILNVKEIARVAHKFGAHVHTDAVQAVGKMEVNVHNLEIDYLSYSAHKIYGPKGVGVLYIKTGTPYATFMHGGHQETGRRSGTENVCGIIGLGKASEIALENMNEWFKRNLFLKNKLIEGLQQIFPPVKINGDLSRSLPHVVNASFPGIEGEALLICLDQAGIAVSTGSACSSGLPSYVLKEIGLESKFANSSIRFSLGYHNNEEQIEYTINQLDRIFNMLKA
jgi:cysteine desulfurase